MTYIVLRRASENTWETVGPTAKEFDGKGAHSLATAQASNNPESEFVVAELKQSYVTKKQVVSQPVSVKAGTVTRLREIKGAESV